MGVSSSESHDLTAFYEMLTASFGVLSQNTGFYPSLDRIIETTLGPLNLGPGGRSYNEPISCLHRNVHEVQSFLGFANFYRRFISSYAEFTQPLTNLCQKNTPWHFGEPESTAFQHLKTAFHTAPVLYHWAPDLPMTVETDASDYAIVGILSVTTPDLEIHLIAFHSRSLHNAERNYNTHDKELLAVFDCYKAWRHYLEGSGHPIDMVTDHKNLEYFTSMKKLTRRQA